MRNSVLALAAASLVAGCSTVPLPPWEGSAPPPPAPAQPPPGAVAPLLEQEQRWLGEWFKDTPVAIGADDDGALRVEVPLQYSFDAGKAAVKPPLAAVLDKVSESLLRQNTARVQVAAPGDRAGTTAAERNASVRGYLVTKGVQPRRITYANGSVDTVALRLLPPLGPIERLEDQPSTAGGRTVTPRPVR